MTIKEINETPIEDIYAVARFLYNLSSHNYEIALKEETKAKEYKNRIERVKDRVRDETSLNDSEIDEIVMILEGDL